MCVYIKIDCAFVWRARQLSQIDRFGSRIVVSKIMPITGIIVYNESHDLTFFFSISLLQNLVRQMEILNKSKNDVSIELNKSKDDNEELKFQVRKPWRR